MPPTWIILALIAPAVFTIVNFIDKYLVSHKVKDYLALPVATGLAGFTFATVLWLLTGRPLIGARDTTLLITSGALGAVGATLYFKVLATNHASYIIALLQTTSLFTLVLAYLLLGERLGGRQLAGFALVLIGVIGLSLGHDAARFRLGSSFWLITLANFFFGLAAVIVKFTEHVHGFAPVLIYESWGTATGVLILFMCIPRMRRAFIDTLRSVSKTTLAIMFVNESLFLVTKAIQFLAILTGVVAIVSVLDAVQVFYGLVVGAVLTLIAPRLFTEELAPRKLVGKLGWSAVLVAGVFLLQ